MNNIETGKFDSLFRNAAVDYELPFEESAWAMMQQKLDGEAKKKRGGFGWWLPVALIALGVGVYFTIGSRNETNTVAVESKVAPAQPNTSAETLPANETNIKTAENNVTTPAEANKLAKDNKANTLPATPKAVTEKHAAASVRGNSNTTTKTTNTKNTTAVATGKNNKSVKSSSPGKAIVSNTNDITSSPIDIPKNVSSSTAPSKTVSSTVSRKNVDVDITEKNAIRYYTATNLPLHNRYVTDFVKLAAENAAAIAKKSMEFGFEIDNTSNLKGAAGVNPVFDRQKPINNWYVYGNIADNIPYVSNPKLSDGSLQYQIGIGYRISKYVSLQTGIIAGNRSFDLRRDQFTYYGPSINEKYITNVSADISLIEVPLTLRYQFSDKDNYGWFFTAGISSVFMNKENYRIRLDNGGLISYDDQNFSGTKSIASLATISVGYQYPISKTFTISAEPYLQLPFKVIGKGGSKISSVGLSIGARYNFLRKKK